MFALLRFVLVGKGPFELSADRANNAACAKEFITSAPDFLSLPPGVAGSLWPSQDCAARQYVQTIWDCDACERLTGLKIPIPPVAAFRGARLARIHRRDTAVALTRGMMGTGRRTGRARSRSMGLKVVGGGHASGQVAAGSGGGRRKRPGGMPEVALAGWAGMSLRDSPWGCPVDGSGADGAPSGW